MDYEVSQGGATFAVTQPRHPQSYRVICLNGSVVEFDTRIDGELFNIHSVQPLGERILLTCSRSHFSAKGDHERNGRIYTREGVLVDEILLGDGIQDVQTTADGKIWVSYFDEGIFGNFGWAEPLGGSGLVVWQQDGTRLREFEATDGLEPIYDCYAMNVLTDQDAWICYYSEFPLVNLLDGRPRKYWNAPATGSAVFAVGEGHCLFQGGYHQRDSYILAELGKGREPRVLRHFELYDEAGTGLTASRATARADVIYLLSGSKLYSVDIATSFAAV
jgi:hypothetical protein